MSDVDGITWSGKCTFVFCEALHGGQGDVCDIVFDDTVKRYLRVLGTIRPERRVS